LDLARLAFLVGYCLRARLVGDKKPILCGIKVTHRCNMRCQQCPYWRRSDESLSYQDLVELFPRLYRDGIRVIILEGGEPLLWRDGVHDLNDLVKEGKRYFPCVGVTTNGTLPIRIGAADIVWVSIDGLEGTHDRLRGKSFGRIVENLSSSPHPNIYANITINRLNVGEIPELIKFLSGLVQGITIQFFFPYEEVGDLSISWAQRRRVLDRLMELKREGYPLADSFAALEALKDNRWQCEPWMMANVDPDGTYRQGCYLLDRTSGSNPCSVCGFAAHTEISLAYHFNLGAIRTGRKVLAIF